MEAKKWVMPRARRHALIEGERLLVGLSYRDMIQLLVLHLNCHRAFSSFNLSSLQTYMGK